MTGVIREARPPLEGLRVLDVGTRISAPFCAGLLGEMGADVIKVEQPGTGDFMREIGPFVPVDDEIGPGHSLFWSVEGRGRRGCTLDLRKPEGQQLFRRLCLHADVVCENFRPGTLERWNVGPVRVARADRDGAHLGLRTGRPRRRCDPGSTAWASATAVCSTSPAIPIVRRFGPA